MIETVHGKRWILQDTIDRLVFKILHSRLTGAANRCLMKNEGSMEGWGDHFLLWDPRSHMRKYKIRHHQTLNIQF